MKAYRAFLLASATLAVGTVTISAQTAQVLTPFDTAIRPAPGIVNPTELKFVEPKYTKAALDAHISGMVVLEAVINTSGTVADARVVQSLDKQYGLDDEAVAAVKQWLFHPAMKDGKPVPILVQLEVMFRTTAKPIAEPETVFRAVVARPPQDRTSVQLPADGFAAGALAADTPGLAKPTEKRFYEPKYTAEAMRQKIQGTVEVEAIIGVDGTVTKARVSESLDKVYGLDDNALAAVNGWTFNPGLLNGQPVPVYVRLLVIFRLH